MSTPMSRSNSDDVDPRHPPFRLLSRVKAELENNWTHDNHLLDNFFPNPGDDNKYFRKAWLKLFNKSKRYNRWKRIPSNPKYLSKLCTPLTNLLNDILIHHEIDQKHRIFLDTHNGGMMGPSGVIPIEPGIFLAGVAPEFATTYAQLPRARFSSGISVLEVALDSEDLTAARDRLAVHMRRITQDQVNRRFAFGLVITQSIFIVYLFDRSGASYSSPCNYHQNPGRFCAVISGLASDTVSIGFDPSIFIDRMIAKFRTTEKDETGLPVKRYYTIQSVLFQSSDVLGRATFCCLTSLDGVAGSFHVIKDAWIALSDPPGRESEFFLVRHARSKGVIDGIVDIVHSEEVPHPVDTFRLDTVVQNRRIDRSTDKARKVERVHTRTVMKTYGKTLDEFTDRKELLFAFHDAVLAHRKLHDVAGVLHRDISVRNILINPTGTEGNRGILIDFDHSIRIDDTSPYSTKRHIGTLRFMSRNVVKGDDPHTYIDDLESFYYVICWIVAGYERPGVGKSPIPRGLNCWDFPDAYIYKDGLMFKDPRFPVSPWARKPLLDGTVTVSEPKKDYDEFLGHIQQAIIDLEKESPYHEEMQFQNEDNVESPKPTLEKREPGSDDDDEYENAKPRGPRKRKAQIFAPRRPLRNTANYGRNLYR